MEAPPLVAGSSSIVDGQWRPELRCLAVGEKHFRRLEVRRQDAYDCPGGQPGDRTVQHIVSSTVAGDP
jgi:hypothetical protein